MAENDAPLGLSEEDITKLLTREIGAAETNDDADLTIQRTKVLEYYEGKLTDLEAEEGRSSVVSKDVSDRGLRWDDVDLERREIRVHQRADRFNTLGQPKSATSERAIPVPGIIVNTLREWRLACPRRNTGQKDTAGNDITLLDLVFPNGSGKVESHANIINRGLVPTWVAAGVTVEVGRSDIGEPICAAKYTGLHSLRHFFASWCINPPSMGGIGLIPKVVQDRLGHSTIAMTMDTYGHLFPRGDDTEELAAAERALLG